jgi:hypothetical protein
VGFRPATGGNTLLKGGRRDARGGGPGHRATRGGGAGERGGVRRGIAQWRGVGRQQQRSGRVARGRWDARD